MSYRFRFQDELNLLVIVFSGVISYEEEIQAVLDTLADPQMQPGARILVDKTNAQMTMTAQEIEPHQALIRRNFARFGQPKVANVVGRDVDFGMTRMYEIKADGQFPHTFMVFRTIEEACAWLGIEAATIQWP